MRRSHDSKGCHRIGTRFFAVVALALVFGGLSGLSGCGAGPQQEQQTSEARQKDPEAITWDQLIPDDFTPEDLLAGIDLSALDDNDPRASELLARMRSAWRDAPVTEALDSSYVRIGGFVVPLEGTPTRVSEFLLVPYHGACIHTPPPPSNQVVHVLAPDSGAPVRMFDAVWVTGILNTEPRYGELADASYTLRADRVDAF